MNRARSLPLAVAASALLAVAALAAPNAHRRSPAATPAPPRLDPGASRITVSVTSWNAQTDAVLVDARGRQTGRSAGRMLNRIPGVVYRYAANEAQAAAAIEPGNGLPDDPSRDYDDINARTRHAFFIENANFPVPRLIDDHHCELRLKALAAGKLHVTMVGVEQGVFRDRDTLSVWVQPGQSVAFDLKWQLAGDSSGVTLVALPATVPATRTR